MGLDISVDFDNQKTLNSTTEGREIQGKLNLSRTFCKLMSRRNVVENIPELDQIGKITEVDISFLYDMELYTEEWEIDEMLQFETNDSDRENRKKQMLAENEKIKNNIDLVIRRLEELISSLSKIDNLHLLLEKTDYDTIGISTYFALFNESPGDGYIGNNFGQDIRNLLALVKFAKDKGAKTAFFNYG